MCIYVSVWMASGSGDHVEQNELEKLLPFFHSLVWRWSTSKPTHSYMWGGAHQCTTKVMGTGSPAAVNVHC